MRRTLVFITTFVLAMAWSVAFPPAAGADGCTDVSLSSDFRLLANRAPVSGTYALEVPAGEYRLIAISTDSAHPTGAEQLNETWYFTTDSGYVSPLVPDLPEGQTYATFDMGLVTVPASNSVTFHHGASGPGAQSVSPAFQLVCPAEAPAPTTTSAPETSLPEPSTTIPPTSSPASPAPTVPSTEPVTSPAPTTAPAVPTSEAPGTVLPAPSIVRPTTTAVATTEPVATSTTELQGEVKPIVITPDTPGGGTLPRTGAGLYLLWTGLLMVGAGSLLLVVARPLAVRLARVER